MVNIDMTLIAQAVNFLFLLWFLNKFAYKPVLKMMEDRKAKIAGDLGTAEAAKNDAEAAKAEAVEALAQARIEAQAIIDNARKNAVAAQEKMLADTRLEQEKVIADAKEAIVMERQKAMDEIRAQVVELSLLAAGKIVEKKLGTASDKKMATELVNSLMK